MASSNDRAAAVSLSVMVRTQDQRIMWASASSVEHLGFAAHELVGLSILDVLESSSSTPLRHLFSGAQTADRRFDDLRVRIARAQGSINEFELRSVRYVETGGQVLAFVRLLPLGVRADQGVNLAAAEHRYAALVRGASDGVVVHDGTRILFVNEAAAQLVGLKNHVDLVGVPIASFISAEDAPVLRAVRRKLREQPLSEHSVTMRLRRLTGDVVPVEASFALVSWAGQDAVQAVLHDVRLEHLSRHSEAVRVQLENAVSEAVISTDESFRISSWNASASAMYGWSVHEVLGRRVDDVLGTLDPRTAPGETIDELSSSDVWRGTVRHKHRDGHTLTVESLTTILRDHDGGVAGLVAVNRPILKLAESDAYDELTGLAGRASLLAAFETARADESSLMVLVDIDHFSKLNARLGSAAGDEVLIGFAARLSASVRADDFVVRLSGDRFGVYGVVESSEEARALAGRLERLIAEPLQVEGSLLSISARLGAAWGSNAHRADRLFEQAERALREAEAKGGRRLCFYEPDTESGGWHDDAIFVAEVREALASGAIHVAYQPIVELSSGRLRKLEALARWDHPQRGAVSPGQFIPLAERSGIIDELGQWILEKACTDAMSLRAEGVDVDLSVNLSVVQLRDPEVAQRVASVLIQTGFAPDRLWIEVTESALIDDQALLPLHQLHDLGAHLVIDDFGTGYATFQYLTRLPVDALKIDTGFVWGLGVDASDTAIVRSVINLGRELGVQVVAEGVETESQRAQLLALNCRLAQGWLFSRALPYDALIAAYGQPRGAATTSAPATSGPPPAANEAMRLAALEACKILDTSTDEAFDSLVQLASQLLSTPMALISLVDADRQWFKARVGIDVTETPRNIAFCAHAIAEPHQSFIVPDTALDVRFASNPLVTGAPNIRSYAGIPILSREELPLGTLCVLDTGPRTFTDEQVGLLKMLAAQAAALLDLRRRAAELNDLIRIRPQPSNQGVDVQLGTALVEWTSDLVLMLGTDTTILYANSATRTMLGFEPSEWVGRSGLDLIHPDDLADASRALADAAAVSGADLPHLLRVARADGSWCHVELVANTLVGVPGMDAIVVNARDVSEKQQANERLMRQREFIDTTLDNLTDAVVACDENGILTVFNLAARRLHDRPGRALTTAAWAATYDLFASDGSTPLETEQIPLVRAWHGERVVDAEMVIAPPGRPRRLVRCNGQQLKDAAGTPIGAMVAMQDITGRRETESLLRHQAVHDQLTGLGNRHALLPHLDRALSDDPTGVTLAFIDLDRLKVINDNHGHRAGDHVLTRFGQRLAAGCEPGDLLTRIGGDEFAVMRHHREGEARDSDQDWMSRLRGAATFSTTFEGRLFDVTASCGMVKGRVGDNAGSILSRADDEMFSVKRHRAAARK